MSTSQWHTKVVPAQLAFLAIYNPSLGQTDDTFRDQLVFYYSRASLEARSNAKKSQRNDAAGGDALRGEENEKLRQIGLAQGMVDFARSFSHGEPVDSIETEKSRIVLKELEKGWWIVASVDLTRLPSLSQPSPDQTKKASDKAEPKASIEYSSREVSPPALLLQQLLQAHCIFCLHHGPSLSDLFVRLTRDKFCNTLDRYWTRFARNWDVLLHGNPAADILNGLKLASGGELGFGVGEEEWGSGEREVLEDLVRRTDGLVDLLVMRFGEPVADGQDKVQEDALPWTGSGEEPIASDGVIFGGVGAVQRHSLRDVSLWIRQIYTQGEHAYGVKDNPSRERRKRKRVAPSNNEANNGDRKESRSQSMSGSKDNNNPTSTPETHATAKSDRTSNQTSDRRTNALPDSRPIIPPPIVSAAEDALKKATDKIDQEDRDSIAAEQEDSGTTLGIPDQYMKYLTFGLSTLGKQTPKEPSMSRKISSTSSKTSQHQRTSSSTKKSRLKDVSPPDDLPALAQLDPVPDGEMMKSKIATQIRQENHGRFIIGLQGDLLQLDDLAEVDETDGSDAEASGTRIVLRTIYLELATDMNVDATNEPSLSRKSSEMGTTPMSETMPDLLGRTRRFRVLVYVHRPFAYCFFFHNQTPSLQLTKFYKYLHRSLVPIHKPLLSSTSVEKVAERVASAQVDSQFDDASSGKQSSSKPASSPIFDLLYDPVRLTLHTSIPNIPAPGTPAAEGIFAGFGMRDNAAASMWTRIDALNVHSQILNTLASVKNRNNEIERTSKTSRGWWVVWMKVPISSDSNKQASEEGKGDALQQESSSHTLTVANNNDTAASQISVRKESHNDHRIAFLVRKATDGPPPPKVTSTSSRAVSSMLEVMSLGMASSMREEDPTGGASAGWGPAALTGGIGIDARKYVEGLLSLNR